MYRVLISEKAKRIIKRLPQKDKDIVLNKIYSIRHDPHRYVKKLEGSHLWRLRIMDYRAVVDIVISGKKIIVLTVDKRNRTYRR